MPSLDKVTDHMLLQQGLVSIDEIEHDGPVMNPMGCGLFEPEHDWSKTQDDIEDEPPYQFCRCCGQVRRSPWRISHAV